MLGKYFSDRADYRGIPKFAVFAAACVTREEGDDASDLDENDHSGEESKEDEAEDVENVGEEYLAGIDEIKNMKAEWIDGDKAGSKWLGLDDIFLAAQAAQGLTNSQTDSLTHRQTLSFVRL